MTSGVTLALLPMLALLFGQLADVVALKASQRGKKVSFTIALLHSHKSSLAQLSWDQVTCLPSNRLLKSKWMKSVRNLFITKIQVICSIFDSDITES